MLRDYYDTQWGMPVHDEQGMYERISLEAFQAGLSWATILRKRPAFRAAFDDFDPERVARYGDARSAHGRCWDRAERAKILAAITSASDSQAP